MALFAYLKVLEEVNTNSQLQTFNQIPAGSADKTSIYNKKFGTPENVSPVPCACQDEGVYQISTAYNQ